MSECLSGRPDCHIAAPHYHDSGTTYIETDMVALVLRLRAENERLAGALRHAARELQYVLDADPCEQAEIHQTGEGRACIALAESVLGPMRDWPEEPNASGVLARAYFAGGGK